MTRVIALLCFAAFTVQAWAEPLIMQFDGKAMGFDGTPMAFEPPTPPEASYTFQGVGDSDDTWFASIIPTNNLDGFQLQIAQNSGNHGHAVLRFNLTNQIPPGYTITQAVMSVTKAETYASFDLLTANIYNINQTNDWVDDEATWNIRKTATGWNGSAGCSTSGTDYDTPLVWTFNWRPEWAVGVVFIKTWSGTGDVAFIQNWLDNPSQNQGVVFIDGWASNHALKLFQSESSNSVQPKLIVYGE